jgi:TPR repeat protein
LGSLRRVGALWAFCCALAQAVLGANPRAGLPEKPEYNSYAELTSVFTNLSFSALEAKGKEGSATAQAALGRRYLEGAGIATNIALAFQWIGLAASNDLPLAQANFGYLLETGAAGDKDLPAALSWYRQASEAGLSSASHRLGWLSANKASPELKPNDCFRFYELAAEQGDLEAACALAWMWQHPPGGGTIDDEKSLYWFGFAASKNYLPAYNGLGWAYMSRSIVIASRSVEPDYQEAERWFRMGTEQGDPECEYGMAMLELQAHEAAPDLSKVRDWLLKASAKNHIRACYQLGRLAELYEVEHPPTAKPDYDEAAKWYQKAADAKHSTAAARLADLTIQGKINSRADIIPALQKASDSGDVNARVELAARYLKGEASPRNANDQPLALLESAGNDSRAMAVLSEVYEVGKLVPRDLIKSVDLLVAAASGWHPDTNATEKLLRLRDTDLGQFQEPEAREQKQALEDYRRAVFSSKPDGAVVLARRYLDGTYPTNNVQAAVWYSLAAKRKDESAAAEARKLISSLDKAGRDQVERQLGGLSWKERMDF